MGDTETINVTINKENTAERKYSDESSFNS